jgi:hypothetical protein
MSTSEHRIPKETVRARLRLRGGAEWDGDLFLDTCSPYHAGPQRLVDFLNQPPRFFPVRSIDGGIRLVAKTEVLVVALPRAAEERFGPAARFASRAAAHVELVDGTTLDGEIDLHEAQVTLPRVVDALNGSRAFFWFRDAATLFAVSKDAIRWVVPADVAAPAPLAEEARCA